MRTAQATIQSINAQFAHLARRVRGDQIHRFYEWFKAQPLGPLEDVRSHVRAHALDSCSDAVESEIYAVARATVEMYLNDPESAREVFDGYRKHKRAGR